MDREAIRTLKILEEIDNDHTPSQRDLSKKINIPESHLSMAIHGRFNLDEIQKNKIAKVLSKPITELFGD